jgi:hypothetical protein
MKNERHSVELEDLLPDIRIVVSFVIGWWPGYEDAIRWDDDIDEEDHEFYMAAKRIRSALGV